jgi:hypothetical protein
VTVLLDTNVWLYLYPAPSDRPTYHAAGYSAALKSMLAAGSRLVMQAALAGAGHPPELRVEPVQRHALVERGSADGLHLGLQAAQRRERGMGQRCGGEAAQQERRAEGQEEPSPERRLQRGERRDRPGHLNDERRPCRPAAAVPVALVVAVPFPAPRPLALDLGVDRGGGDPPGAAGRARARRSRAGRGIAASRRVASSVRWEGWCFR